MKILAFVLCVVASFLHADTWSLPQRTGAVTCPPGETGSAFWLMYGGSSPNNVPRAYINQGSGAGYSSPEPYARTVSITVGPGTSSNPFYIIIGWRTGGGDWLFQHWYNAFNVTQDPNGNGNDGGFNDAGQGTGANGLPVDSNGNNVNNEPKNRWDKTIELTNDTDAPKTFKIVTKDLAGNTIGEKVVTVPPGARVPWKMSSPEAFAYDVFEGSTVDGGETAWDPVQSGNAVGTTPTENGGAATPTTATSGQGGAMTPTATTEVPNTPNESRPGTSPDPNAENRHKELKGEVGRIVSQVKAAMDKAHADALHNAGQNTSIEKVLEGIKGAVESGSSVNAGDIADEIGGLSGNVDTAGDGSVTSAIATAATTVQKYEQLKASVDGAVNALRTMLASFEASDVGAESWDFDLTLPQPVGTMSFNFTPFAWFFATVRQVELWTMGLVFILVYLKMIRGAFVG